MNITLLDSDTLGHDISLQKFNDFGNVVAYAFTNPDEVKDRIAQSDVVIINKIKLNKTNLHKAKRLKLICIAATGYDNVDVDYCRENGIAVCNVVGYSTDSVALITMSLALSLVTHLREYNDYVISGKYTQSGIPNKLEPPYHELSSMTWGVVGYGNIGKKVAKIAEAFGCNVIYTRQTPDGNCNCVDLETLCKESDIISLHTPLTEKTNGLIGEKELSLMKNSAILINVARGKVTDEAAVARAVKSGKIGGLGVDVYSAEPIAIGHPFDSIKSFPNVVLTPHYAWGAYEARIRCLDEIYNNIKAFNNGEIRSRVDL